MILHEWSFHMTLMKLTKARFINFIWNDHEFKILFIIRAVKMVFYRLKNELYCSNTDASVVIDVTYAKMLAQVLW